MKIKVCGMRDPDNIQALSFLEVDMIGMIFYEGSSRNYIDHSVACQVGLDRVGVFVNESIDKISRLIETQKLNYIQLHGDESPDYCKSIAQRDVSIIKAFGVDSAFDFKKLENYLDHVDYFLFDTKGDRRGGNGQHFDWSLLSEYVFNKPFILSGGIGPNDVKAIQRINHNSFWAIDLNSKFEINPGLKNIELIKDFIDELRN